MGHTSALQVFMVFYAILYGVMLSSLNSFVPFPWGDIDDCRRGKRVVLSIFILNLLPFLYFLGVSYLIRNDSFSLISLNQFIFNLLVLASALGVFAFYRLYHIIFFCDSNEGFWPKCQKECDNPNFCEANIKDCQDYIISQRNTEGGIRGNLLGIFIYLIPSMFIGYMKGNIDFVISIILFLILIILFWALCCKCKTEHEKDNKKVVKIGTMKIVEFKTHLDFLKAVEPLVILATVALILADQAKDNPLTREYFLLAGIFFLISILYIFIGNVFRQFIRSDQKESKLAEFYIKLGHLVLFSSYFLLVVGLFLFLLQLKGWI